MNSFQVAYKEEASLASRLSGLVEAPEVSGHWNELIEAVTTGNKMMARAKIEAIEAILSEMPQADHILEHSFIDGLYIRLAGIPSGVMFTTPVHLQSSVLSIMAGDIVIVTENGIEEASAGRVFISKPGTKRLVLVINSVLATTVHANPDGITDVETLEARIYGPLFGFGMVGGPI